MNRYFLTSLLGLMVVASAHGAESHQEPQIIRELRASIRRRFVEEDIARRDRLYKQLLCVTVPCFTVGTVLGSYYRTGNCNVALAEGLGAGAATVVSGLTINSIFKNRYRRSQQALADERKHD